MGRAAPRHQPAFPIARRHEPPETHANYGQGRGGRPWRRKRAAVLQRDGYLCQCDDCRANGKLLVAHEVDHIVPLSQGGTDDPSNLRAINRNCHRAKTQREAGGSRRRARSVGT